MNGDGSLVEGWLLLPVWTFWQICLPCVDLPQQDSGALFPYVWSNGHLFLHCCFLHTMVRQSPWALGKCLWLEVLTSFPASSPSCPTALLHDSTPPTLHTHFAYTLAPTQLPPHTHTLWFTWLHYSVPGRAVWHGIVSEEVPWTWV